MLHCVAVCCSVLQCAPTMANHGRVYVHAAVLRGVLVSYSAQITPTVATRLKLCVLPFAQPLSHLLSLSLSFALFSRALSFYIYIYICIYILLSLSRTRALFVSLSLTCALPLVRTCVLSFVGARARFLAGVKLFLNNPATLANESCHTHK